MAYILNLVCAENSEILMQIWQPDIYHESLV